MVSAEAARKAERTVPMGLVNVAHGANVRRLGVQPFLKIVAESAFVFVLTLDTFGYVGAKLHFLFLFLLLRALVRLLFVPVSLGLNENRRTIE